MTPRDALGPFQPGPGGMPPYLAGREPEQALLGNLLHRLRERAPLSGEVILYGPRGNGKTVLLRWLEKQATASGVEAMALLPGEVRDREHLAELLRPRRWWRRFVPRGLGLGGVSWEARTEGAGPSPASATLRVRAGKAPLLLLVDEAHTLAPDVGRALLQASQWVRERTPFLMVLAGTPQVEERLGRMEASFWSRSRQIRIGRLDAGATGEAFRRPFEEAGVPVEDTVLPEVVRQTHGYPYFIQLLGEAAWSSARAPGRVTTAVLEAAGAMFDKIRGHYYRQRYDELRKQGLLATGRSVAEAFAGGEFLTDEALTRAVARGCDDSPDAPEVDRAEGVLSDLGFIWRTSSAPGWEPGIPSLMDYVARHAPAP